MLAGSLSFAVMGALTHAVGTRCHWLVVGWTRAGFMLVTMVALARWSGVKLVILRPRTLWIRSLAGSFSLICNFYALVSLPVAEALTLSHTYPLWIVVLLALVFRRPPTVWETLGVICATLGVWLIERGGFSAQAWPVTVALASALATAIAMLGLHRLRNVDPRAIVAHFAGVAFVVASAALAWKRIAIAPVFRDKETVALLLGVATTGTTGQLCLTRAYASGNPARLATVGLTQVVFALVIDVLFWGRTVTALVGAGFFLVLAPSALLSGLATRRFLRESMGESATVPANVAIPPE